SLKGEVGSRGRSQQSISRRPVLVKQGKTLSRVSGTLQIGIAFRRSVHTQLVADVQHSADRSDARDHTVNFGFKHRAAKRDGAVLDSYFNRCRMRAYAAEFRTNTLLNDDIGDMMVTKNSPGLSRHAASAIDEIARRYVCSITKLME